MRKEEEIGRSDDLLSWCLNCYYSGLGGRCWRRSVGRSVTPSDEEKRRLAAAAAADKGTKRLKSYLVGINRRNSPPRDSMNFVRSEIATERPSSVQTNNFRRLTASGYVKCALSLSLPTSPYLSLPLFVLSLFLSLSQSPRLSVFLFVSLVLSLSVHGGQFSVFASSRESGPVTMQQVSDRLITF